MEKRPIDLQFTVQFPLNRPPVYGSVYGWTKISLVYLQLVCRTGTPQSRKNCISCK